MTYDRGLLHLCQVLCSYSGDDLSGHCVVQQICKNLFRVDRGNMRLRNVGIVMNFTVSQPKTLSFENSSLITYLNDSMEQRPS